MLKIAHMAVISVFLVAYDAYSFDNVITHRDITKNAIEKSNLDKYLIANLGFQKGVETDINGTSVIKWIREGSYLEDKPACRASNHFHNPLLPWDQSFMTDSPWWINTWCVDWPRYSNVTWGTGYLAPSPDGQKANFTIAPAYAPQNWNVARDYYYQALTENLHGIRMNALAKTFSTIGQVMHLLEDMAVPAHTRNDFTSHLIKNNGCLIDRIQPFENYVKNNPDLVTAAQFDPPSFTNPRLTDFWDTDQYNGSNPSTLHNIGLSEFTNANYLSDFTIPSNGPTPEHTFPYPYISGSNISGPGHHICYDLVPGTYLYRSYISRKDKDGGVCPQITPDRTVDHFATPSFLNEEPLIINNNIANIHLWLDDNVHNTYAKELLPRAVGYSAGLLNYFFRGKLGITQVSGGVKIKNLGLETMSTYVDRVTQTTIGTIKIFYDDPSRYRTFLANYDLTTPLELGAETDVIYFAPPASNIFPKRYIAVFRGKLGNEEGAVIGKVALIPHVYYVATISGWDKIYKIDADGTNQSLVYDNPDGYVIGKIALSPDGNTLAFASSPDGLVVKSTIKTLNLTDTTFPPTVLTSGNWPSWSPDGSKIAFERDISQYPYSADIEIFTVDVATGEETQLTNILGSSYSGSPAWSPDGNSIAYSKFVQSQTGCATNYVISLMDTAGNPIGPLTCPPAGQYMSVGDFDPAWSPDGQEIAFTRRRYVGRSSQLYKVAVATQAITKLTDSPDVGFDEYTPAWLFEEMSIAIGSMRDGDYDIWLVDPYGGGYKTNLTNSNPDMDGYPAFGQ